MISSDQSIGGFTVESLATHSLPVVAVSTNSWLPTCRNTQSQRNDRA